jgi:hypothetical protein
VERVLGPKYLITLDKGIKGGSEGAGHLAKQSMYLTM